MKRCFLSFLFIPALLSADVKIGIDRLITDQFHLIEGKNIGIITNHTGILSTGEHFVDYLFAAKKVNIKALFGPEHGIRGDAPDGKKIPDAIDKKTGVPIYSLYGEIRKPTKEMLMGISILIFDIQDIGARFYTYISTLNNCLEAAAENNIRFIVCDRPNPIGGIKVDGPILKSNQKSFVGIQPIPIQHGMTIGELALMFNNEGWLKNGMKADLTVIEVINWKREQFFDETGLNWINPSPNIVNLDAAIIYPGLCLIEGTNVSEGRGTMKPFLTIGAPFINSEILFRELDLYHLKGVKFKSTAFTPKSTPNMSTNPKFKDVQCWGIEILITDRDEIEAVRLGISIIHAINKLFKDDFVLNKKRSNLLVGDESITEMILMNVDLSEIFKFWQSELDSFKKIRNKYLLYS
jgi:uncharacterized protein YbbC (DUF1343 family)